MPVTVVLRTPMSGSQQKPSRLEKKGGVQLLGRGVIHGWDDKLYLTICGKRAAGKRPAGLYFVEAEVDCGQCLRILGHRAGAPWRNK